MSKTSGSGKGVRKRRRTRKYQPAIVCSELAAAIVLFARTHHRQAGFATYSNGERRGEEKKIDMDQQATAYESILHALRGM